MPIVYTFIFMPITFGFIFVYMPITFGFMPITFGFIFGFFSFCTRDRVTSPVP